MIVNRRFDWVIENARHVIEPRQPGKKSDTEDALAIVNRRGRPHLFITITMNADWPEITLNLQPGQTAYDRPDLCARVFKIKLKEIMKEIKSGKVLVLMTVTYV